MAYALTIGTKINDLERPIRTLAEQMCFTEPSKNIWMKTDPYYQVSACFLIRDENILLRKHMRCWWQAITQLQLTPAVKFPSDSRLPDWKQILVFSEFYVYPHLSLCVLFISGLYCLLYTVWSANDISNSACRPSVRSSVALCVVALRVAVQG